MGDMSYQLRRDAIEAYFDRTAVEAWRRLTSDQPVSGIRATVRAGRDAMRAMLLSWLPAVLTGRRLLDAGCGTGALAVEAARRGAEVVAVDLSPQLIGVARERVPAEIRDRITFLAGDMLDPDLGLFDHAVAMDSVIHYEADDVLRMLRRLAPRVGGSLLFTIAPRTPLLSAMHAAGKAFPRADRSPAIVPLKPRAITEGLGGALEFAGWRVARQARVSRGFYISQAIEVTRE
jgi:magnesium-protoporphyrin O-methyltransferase